MMKYLNIDVAGEFILMAASMALIKSRMMLPVPRRDGCEDDEDPRMEIIRPLMEYIRLKSSAAILSEKYILGEDVFVRKPGADELQVSDDPDCEFVEIGLLELYDAFAKILENRAAAHIVDATDESFSISKKVEQLTELLKNRQNFFFHELFSNLSSKTEIIVTFLAVLEMVKRSIAGIFQHVENGFIHIRKV